MSDEFDVIFHWGELHSWLGDDWQKYFTKPTRDITLPRGASRSTKAYKSAIEAAYTDRPIHHALTQRGWARQGVRVGVLGFSETCMGAAVLLGGKDGGSIDFAFANDGIHSNLDVWTQYARMAAFGYLDNANAPPTERCLVITHSQTPGPPNLPSTSETAAQIAKTLAVEPFYTKFVPIPELKDAEHEPIKCRCSYSDETVTYTQVPGLYNTHVGNLYILGYENQGKTCTDHVYQSKVIGPRVLEHILAPRWNDNDRNSGTCVVT